ncbi:hypothetical protein [Novosphingobium sp. Chol11]|uniref:hypothetical protein n=1 Tax=Novosphingobium sp. Chol11 TaxID=1385763 RepID=UPI0025D041E2|nr:hypothetical protein [Novosphingobium sp. Chol11]
MSERDPIETLAGLQRTRDAARARMRDNLATVRAELSARSIPARIGDRAAEAALDSLETAKNVARENKLVLGVTAAALLGWLLRGPITRLLGSRLPRIPAKWWPSA